MDESIGNGGMGVPKRSFIVKYFYFLDGRGGYVRYNMYFWREIEVDLLIKENHGL